MGISLISGKELRKIDSLFYGWNETLILSCLQGYMGKAWVDNSFKPKSAQIVLGDFCFFAGVPNEALLRNFPNGFCSNFIIMVPQNEDWALLIEQVYKEKAIVKPRYAIKKEKDIFDIEKLEEIVKKVSKDYEIKLIDEKLYNLVLKNEWSKDFCFQFKNYLDFKKRGLGVFALKNGELVSGASSYSIYKDGIEIEIGTKVDFRRKGLASACGSRLILECLKRNLYPSWDAQNKSSVALAEKLGYNFDKEYVSYVIEKG
ncbi:MAG: GNAT family N-acetyltransferase [Sphaerochaetaceae bacterium]|nr:GNAT family N-acetyltransferase [Sphaerochaetaceae bacterium]